SKQHFLCFGAEHKKFAVFKGFYIKLAWFFLIYTKGDVADPGILNGKLDYNFRTIAIDIILSNAALDNEGLEVAHLAWA
ncbi:MAG TPA: hypothetical protein VK476_02545, partial [Flavobacterium sp.]|nr:hypothetical protein [Flavobacterium sp.]